MAGIIANSASKTMVAGDTSVDNSVTGFVTREPITLSVTGTPSAVAWAIARPSASVAPLTTDTLSASFTPDTEGFYVLTAVVDGTTSYVLRISATQVAHITTLSATRFMPIPNASVPAPATGRTLFCSSEVGGLAVKLPNGTVLTVQVS